MSKNVSIKRLKEFALERLPADSVLRDLILGEDDDIQPEDYCVKTSVWLKLLDHER